MSLVLTEGAHVQFYNCCFTHSTVQNADSLVFVDIAGPGVVDFSAVCFDAVESSSIQSSGGATVNYPGSSFEGCQCFIFDSSYSEEPGPASDSDSSDPFTSSGGSDPESSASSHTDTDVTVDPAPEGGGGAKVNAGLVAGIVVAVLVIIAIIVVVIVLLLIRRREKNTGDSQGGDQEFTEETITTVSEHTAQDDTGEWSQTTEDNPLFATENFDDDSPFTNAFEEDGFFQE